MKTFLLIVAFGLVSVTASAQFDQGRFLAGGALGFDFSKNLDRDNGRTTERSRTVSSSFNPTFGYFFLNRFAIGAVVSVNNSRTEYAATGDLSRSEEITLSPMFRYYLPQRIFFQLRVPLGAASRTVESNSNVSRRTYGVSGLALAAGYSIPLNSNVALEPMLQYSSTVYRDHDDLDREIANSFSFRMGFQIYLGR